MIMGELERQNNWDELSHWGRFGMREWDHFIPADTSSFTETGEEMDVCDHGAAGSSW